MTTSRTRSSRRRGSAQLLTAGLAAMALLAAACSDDAKDSTPTAADTTPETTTVVDTTAAPETTGTETTVADTVAPELSESAIFPTLAPPTGEEIVVGFVGSEGTPGLDFPEMRVDMQATVDYLNEHGGLGGRPIKLETCAVKGSQETSQACAQELAGKNVELVLIGLDLFPDYPTYTAAKIPVIGVLPILPGDYTANALFLTGGNATTMGAIVAAAVDHYKATSVGIIAGSNSGADGSQAGLTASLDLAGIKYKVVTGGDNETDAGYQGLVREAASDNPDLLVSLYAEDGCAGTIRGRAALGIEIPVITTAICSGRTVLDAVGDDAVGWAFVGVQTQQDTPELAILQAILAPALGVAPEEIDSTALGLGALSVIQLMSLTMYANTMQANGDAVTGQSLYDFVATSTGLVQWPSGTAIECGIAEKYPTICSFSFPIAEYLAGGAVETIEGLEAVSAKEFLP